MNCMVFTHVASALGKDESSTCDHFDLSRPFSATPVLMQNRKCETGKATHRPASHSERRNYVWAYYASV